MKFNIRTSLLQKSFIDSHVDRLPPHKAITLQESATLQEAIEIMIAEGIGCILVNSPRSKLSGIVTERDILKRAWSLPGSFDAIPLSEIMTPSPQFLNAHASIARALYLMSEGGFRHIPIILKDNSVSMVSVTDFIHFIAARIAARMEKREEALEVLNLEGGIERFFDGELSILSPSKPVMAEPTTPLSEVVKLMVARGIGSLVIGNTQERRVRGIFTERDLLKKATLNRGSVHHLPVAEFMTASPVTLQSTTSIFYAFESMSTGKFRHLPIVDFDERLTGILSVKNMVDFLAREIVSELTKR